MDDHQKWLLETLKDLDREVEIYELDKYRIKAQRVLNLKDVLQELDDKGYVASRHIPGGYHYYRILPKGKRALMSAPGRMMSILIEQWAHNPFLVIGEVGGILTIISFVLAIIWKYF